jgi:hypothetical protein
MINLKHVGRFVANGKKCLVAYRTLPGDAYSCLVVATESLTDSFHDALIQLVESNAAQESNEFADVLSRSLFPDGSNMLFTLHNQGRLTKVPTDQIEMMPNFQTKIRLDELNVKIAEQLGVAIDDLAVKPREQKKDKTSEVVEVARVNEVPASAAEQLPVESSKSLSKEDQARQYRGQADKLSKQAAELRRLAEDLVPIKKNVAKKVV